MVKEVEKAQMLLVASWVFFLNNILKFIAY